MRIAVSTGTTPRSACVAYAAATESAEWSRIHVARTSERAATARFTPSTPAVGERLAQAGSDEARMQPATARRS